MLVWSHWMDKKDVEKVQKKFFFCLQQWQCFYHGLSTTVCHIVLAKLYRLGS